MSARNWMTLAILSILWGGSFLFVELALQGLPVLTIVWARVTLAATLLAAWLMATGGGFAPRRAWGALMVMGVLNNAVPFTALVLAQGQITGGLASILNATTPLWTVIVAHLFTADEKLSRAKALGIALGFAGVVVIAGEGEGGPVSLWAIAACLCAALSYGLAGVWGRRFKPMGLGPLHVAVGMLSAASLLLLPLWLALDRPWTMALPAPTPIAAVVGLATLSTALAYVLYFRLLASAGAVMLSLVTFLIPASAIALGVLVLDEPLHPRHLAGLALILLGLVAMDGRIAKWRS